MYLIERLEADRQYSEEALHTERQRKRILGSEVDSMALWKQQELTLAVQEGLWEHLLAVFDSQNNESNTLLHSCHICGSPPLPEHAACISDVAELKRQLELERDKLDQAQEKLSHAELLNQRLHQEISSAKAQIPNVKESLELQRGITTQIKVALAQVSHVASEQTAFVSTSHLGHLFLSGQR